MVSLSKFIKKEIELRENLVGTGFIDPPAITEEQVQREFYNQKDKNLVIESRKLPCADYRFTFLGEIVQASGFNAERLYIFYDMFTTEGWTYEDQNSYEFSHLTSDINDEVNRRKSVTQISRAAVRLIEDDDVVEGTEYVSHFGFPLDFQFLVKQKNFESRPYLLLQVNSVDSWDRHRVEGYAFVRMPTVPGYHQVEVDTWRPRGSLQSEIHSFFLGGSIRINKLEEICRTKFIDEQGKSDVVNRFGLETENSGRVLLNLNMCYQNDVDKRKNRRSKQLRREMVQVETVKQVMEYKLRLDKDIKAKELANNQIDPRPEYPLLL